MAEYKPSPLVRWPLHLLSAMMALVILLLVGTGLFFRYLDEPLPWPLLLCGGGVCLFFIALNTAVAGLRLTIGEAEAVLAVGPWRRRAPYAGARLVKEIAGTGVAAVRLHPGGGGRRLWLSPAWFREFDAALAELERRVAGAGGEVREVPR